MKVLKDVINEFLEYKKSYCEKDTIEYYSNCIYKYIVILDLSLYADIRIAFCRDNVEKFVSTLRDASLTNNSIKTYVRGMKVIFKYACDKKYIEDEIYKNIKTPKKNNDLKLPLTRKEVGLIDDYLVEKYENDYIYFRNYIIFHLMLDAGLRLREVVNLCVKDVDLSKQIIFIRDSKNNKSRFIPLPAILFIELNKYIAFRKTVELTDEKLFLTNKLDRGIEPTTVKNFISKLKKQVGIPRLHSHLLRHTYATSYIMYYNNLEYLRALMGHDDFNITKIYIQSSTTCKLLKYDVYRVDDIEGAGGVSDENI